MEQERERELERELEQELEQELEREREREQEQERELELELELERDIMKFTNEECTEFPCNCKEAKNKMKKIFETGKNYLIRTVTMIYTGKLVYVSDKELVITNACWIAETERWADTCEKGIFKEVEPYPQKANIIIGRGAILDMFKVEWKLPTEQK